MKEMLDMLNIFVEKKKINHHLGLWSSHHIDSPFAVRLVDFNGCSGSEF